MQKLNAGKSMRNLKLKAEFSRRELQKNYVWFEFGKILDEPLVLLDSPTDLINSSINYSGIETIWL